MEGRLLKILVSIFIALMAVVTLSGCIESDYERAGKEFGSWVNTDPNKWTDTQKTYFNDFMDWTDKH